MESYKKLYLRKRKTYLKRKKAYLENEIMLADEAFIRGDYDKSSFLYSLALSELPKKSDLIFKKAYSFWFLGHNDKALAGFNEAISIEPSNDLIPPDFYYYRACVYIKMCELDKGRLDYEASIKHSPESSVAYYGMCNYYILLEQPEKAIKYVKKALSLEVLPEYTTAYLLIKKDILLTKTTGIKYGKEQRMAFFKKLEKAKIARDFKFSDRILN